MESEIMVTDFWKTKDCIKWKKHGFDDIFCLQLWKNQYFTRYQMG